MAGMTHLNHSLVAAGRVAPAARWSANHAASLAGNRHHLTVIAPMLATYQVKPSFKDIVGITRPLTEDSS